MVRCPEAEPEVVQKWGANQGRRREIQWSQLWDLLISTDAVEIEMKGVPEVTMLPE